MTLAGKNLIATVCLERTRWGRREPSFAVSAWLPRFRRDGFDGAELWEYHYTRADEAEKKRLEAAAEDILIYNSYVGFDDESAPARAVAADVVTRLGIPAVKYNLGHNADGMQMYRKNLLAWAEKLPADCRLLCECHQGSVLEHAADAATFFAELDPVRFGVITHVSGQNTEQLQDWFETLGGRIAHLHIQLREPEQDPADAAARARLADCFAVVREHDFKGSMSMEFTRGIGRDEDIEALYANAVTDMQHCRELRAG